MLVALHIMRHVATKNTPHIYKSDGVGTLPPLGPTAWCGTIRELSASFPASAPPAHLCNAPLWGPPSSPQHSSGSLAPGVRLRPQAGPS